MNKRLFACVSIWLASIWPQLVFAQEQVRVISSTSVIQAEANQPPLYNVSYHFQGQTYTVQMPQDPGPYLYVQVVQPEPVTTTTITTVMPAPAPVVRTVVVTPYPYAYPSVSYTHLTLPTILRV